MKTGSHPLHPTADVENQTTDPTIKAPEVSRSPQRPTVHGGNTQFDSQQPAAQPQPHDDSARTQAATAAAAQRQDQATETSRLAAELERLRAEAAENARLAAIARAEAEQRAEQLRQAQAVQHDQQQPSER